jgi:hypothetical protein
MQKLLKTSNLVKEILTETPATRNSDSLLYLKVIERIAAQSDQPIDLTQLTVPYFLCNIKKLNFPYFETVRRTRQKVQEQHPELKSSAEVERVKAEKEKVYRAYALGGEV